MSVRKLSQVDLNLLIALDVLLRERNVTLAGRQIGLSQPAMSAALAKLRELFDDALLVRVGRSYRLTPLAQGLAEPLQAALTAVQRTLDHDIKFEPATSTRTFSLAMSDHLLVVFCPQLVARMRQLAPGVRLHTQPVTPDIGAILAARRVDLSIQPANLVRDCGLQRLFEDRWICAAWRGNQAIKGHITREQLCSLPHASFGVTRVPLAEQLLSPPLARTPNIQVIARNFVSLPFMLRGTDLIALIQYSLGKWAEEVAEIRLIELPIPTAALEFEMSWNPANNTDPAHRWLRGVIAELAQSVFDFRAGSPTRIPRSSGA